MFMPLGMTARHTQNEEIHKQLRVDNIILNTGITAKLDSQILRDM
jgi:hypothetical protein